MQDLIGRVFGGIDRLIGMLRSGVRASWDAFRTGPLTSVVVAVIIGLTGLLVLAETIARATDKVLSWLEKGVVMGAMLLMTALTFNEYVKREAVAAYGQLDFFLFEIEGQMPIALLLMVVTGFIGASLATQERTHIAVDAVDRLVSPRAARLVRRISNLASAVVCALFMQGAWDAVYERADKAFEGAVVWAPFVPLVNAVTSLIPGEKWGPGTPYEKFSQWEDAMYDQGYDWDTIPRAFQFVEVGDRFPQSFPLFLITIIFGVMALRFIGHALYPPFAESPIPGPPTTTTGSRGRAADLVLAGLFPGALFAMSCGALFGQGTLILAGSIMLVFLGAPLFVAVGAGTLATWIVLEGASAETVFGDMFEATRKQELLAIPFFVLAGNLMTRGSIAKRLIAVAQNSIGFLPGGLGAGAVIACAFFAAISGSSPVTVIAIGSILFPMLIAEGYSERYSIGVLSTAGGLGIIIPPSIPMIIYAIIVGGNDKIGAIDPAVLFKAGIGPGLFIAAVLIAYTFFLWWPRPGEPSRLQRQITRPPLAVLARNFGTSLVKGAPSLMLPIIILGGIYGWFNFSFMPISLSFTVTEASAIAVVYALFVELVIHRELRLKNLPKVFSESATMMGSLFLILVIAISLNRYMYFEGVAEAGATTMVKTLNTLGRYHLGLFSIKFTFLIVVNLFLLALGCVMDIISAILIVAPLLAPIAAAFGIDPIHFGIMFIVNLELGYLTPPLGINLFVASTVFDRPLLDVIRAVVPFLLLMLFCLAVIVWFPGLSLFLVQ